MKMYKFLFIPLLCSGVRLAAQQNGLSVGDTCPDFRMDRICNYSKPAARRSDFKTPLLLLQFCSPGCLACVRTVPVLDSLQKAFAGELSVVLVTSRSAAYLQKVKKQVAIRSRYNLPYVVEDTVLHTLFPNKVTPHMVWIDNKGVIKAITSFNYVTAPNIRAVLQGKKLGWMEKKEVADFDYSKPLLAGNEGVEPLPVPLYYTAVTANLKGAGRKKVADSAGGCRRIYLVNFSLLELYRNTLVEFHLAAARPKRTIWQVKDTARYFFDGTEAYADQWEKDNFFCYESRLPLSVTIEEQWEQMRLDLNRYFNLNARLEKRRTNCWVLIRKEAKENWPQRVNGKYGPGIKTLNSWVAMLNASPGWPPVLNETGLPATTAVEIKGGVMGVEEIKNALQKYGLQLIEEEREIEFFIIAEKPGV